MIILFSFLSLEIRIIFFSSVGSMNKPKLLFSPLTFWTVCDACLKHTSFVTWHLKISFMIQCFDGPRSHLMQKFERQPQHLWHLGSGAQLVVPQWAILSGQLVMASNLFFCFSLVCICMCACSCSSGEPSRRKWQSWRRQLLQDNKRRKRRGLRGNIRKRKSSGHSRKKKLVWSHPSRQREHLKFHPAALATYYCL